ncbi:MAG: slipin family protein [Candidatus Diapherotrites archaeon]|uniref:Slipin family protein n=2 Tax=Candidatus Iainarchaeum sp. TaxID=3101447 RepID=A0A8T4KW88_9ARCH|nr:slipin family protein [Candidatus Diapherotrites archaeon]
MVLETIALIIVVVIIIASIRVIQQWETGVRFRIGRYKDTLRPGLNFVIPILDSIKRIDMRILTIDIPRQQVITKDNVPVSINGVVYFKVVDAATAIIKVQDYVYAVSQYAQTALRDVAGGMSLDQVLGERENIGKDIENIVEEASKDWGIEVTDIKLQDIDMPEDLKRLMSRQASSEREKRATIIKSEGDKMAAENLSKAASVMAKSPGAMQLRTLQTLDGLGPTASNTVIIAIPVEVMDLARNLDRLFGKKKK